MSDAVRAKPWHEILASLSPLILGICVTGVGALFTQVYNNRQLQLNQITALDKLRPLLVSDSSTEREFGYAFFTALGYEGLALKIMQLKRDSAGRSVALDIQLSGSRSAKDNAKVTLSVLPTPIRVFGHIGKEDQRTRVEGALVALQAKAEGYSFVGVENVSGKATLPKTTEIRYFNDQDKDPAETIAQLLRVEFGPTVEAKKVAIPSVKLGTIEVWFAQDEK
jgi:hypothetical protein